MKFSEEIPERNTESLQKLFEKNPGGISVCNSNELHGKPQKEYLEKLSFFLIIFDQISRIFPEVLEEFLGKVLE